MGSRSVNSQNGLVMAGLAAFGAILLFARSKTKTIIVDPNIVKRFLNRLQIKVGGYRVQNGQLVLLLKINNPNPNDVIVQAFVGDVYLNNAKIGTVAFYNGKIPALRDSELVLGIKFITGAWIQNFLEYFTGRLKGASVDFVGTMTVNNQILSVKENFRL